MILDFTFSIAFFELLDSFSISIYNKFAYVEDVETSVAREDDVDLVVILIDGFADVEGDISADVIDCPLYVA